MPMWRCRYVVVRRLVETRNCSSSTFGTGVTSAPSSALRYERSREDSFMSSRRASAIAVGMVSTLLYGSAAAQSQPGPTGPLGPSPIPAGWTCAGNCGTDSVDGVVSLSPTGNPAYEWASTSGGVLGVGVVPTGGLGSETNGSTLSTPNFSATAGTPLEFYFNYVTSDGAGFADYAWAELFTSSNVPVALLFTAR